MKAIRLLSLVLIMLVSSVGCNSVDDAARVGSGFVDDAARTGSRVIDDAARAGSAAIDDAARSGSGTSDEVAALGSGLIDDVPRAGASTTASSLMHREVDNSINGLTAWVDNLTPDQKEKMESTLISATCLFLLSSFEGRLPARQELFQHISPKLIGYFGEEFGEVYDLVIDLAGEASTQIQESGVDQTTMTDYCELID